jgi:hypothetical protein
MIDCRVVYRLWRNKNHNTKNTTSNLSQPEVFKDTVCSYFLSETGKTKVLRYNSKTAK